MEKVEEFILNLFKYYHVLTLPLLNQNLDKQIGNENIIKLKLPGIQP